MDRDTNPVRRSGLYRLNIILLSLITMLSAAGALYLREELRRAWEPGDGQSRFGSEKIEELKKEAAEQEREKVLAEIRQSLEDGTTVSGMLRDMFADQIVITAGGRYWFMPVEEDTGLRAASRDDFEIGEDGAVRYTGGAEGVSAIRGIDVSEANGDIDWERTAGDQVAFAMVHLGTGQEDGTVSVDRRFARNAAGALQNGLQLGCYMEIYGSDRESILNQTEGMLAALRPFIGRLNCPAALVVHMPDGWESSTEEERQSLSEALQTACTMIEEAGCTPAIGGDIAALTLLLDPAVLADRAKWYTGYDETLYYPYAWSLWQYRAGGTIEGITGDVNLNIHLVEETAE